MTSNAMECQRCMSGDVVSQWPGSSQRSMNTLDEAPPVHSWIDMSHQLEKSIEDVSGDAKNWVTMCQKNQKNAYAKRKRYKEIQGR